MPGIDPHVRLDFVYIPKNAYQSSTLFGVINRVQDWMSPSEIDALLWDRNREGYCFWDRQPRYRGQRSWAQSDRSTTIEVVRDMLDLAAYLDLLDKHLGFARGRRATLYKLTTKGKRISEGVLSRDPTVLDELRQSFLSYRMTNEKIDVDRYTHFLQFSARPWFVLLKLLHDFQERYPDPSLEIHPKELGLVVLCVRKETDAFFEEALERMYAFARDGALHRPKRGNAFDWTALDDHLRRINYTQRSFDSITNTQRTRLFNYAYYLGLIDAEPQQQPQGSGFYNLLDTGIGVASIRGLSDIGRAIYQSLKRTRYYSVSYNLSPLELLISRVMTEIDCPVPYDQFTDLLIKLNICNREQFTVGISRLQDFRIVRRFDSQLELDHIPIFGHRFTPDILEEIESDVRDVLRLLAPSSLVAIETEALQALPPSLPYYAQELETLRTFLAEKHILQREWLEHLYWLGIDPYFSDYLLLAHRDERLATLYTDLAEKFEFKTRILFEQMAFDQVDHIGQNVGRGRSYPDVIALWHRFDGEIHTHLTIIECKAHSRGLYLISPSDVDSMIRQIGKVLERPEYANMRAYLDTILFVSSGFAGGYRAKLVELKEAVTQRLALSVRCAAISATDLLLLYSLVRRHPRAFQAFHFNRLFRETLITSQHIRSIFS